MAEAVLESGVPGRYRVSGVLDATTAPGLVKQMEKAFTAGEQSDVHVDLAGVKESDSSGLALLLEWLRLARQQRRAIHFTNIPEQICALARISEVEELLKRA